MELIWQGLLQALTLLAGGDSQVWQITWLSLRVSATATLLSLVFGIPLGTAVALTRFPGRGFVVSLINTGMGLPPVVVGLFVTIVLWRNGVLGGLELLYTPTAMILAQLVIAAPIVTGLTLAAIQQVPERFRLQLLALGASRAQLVWTLLRRRGSPCWRPSWRASAPSSRKWAPRSWWAATSRARRGCSPPPPCSRRARATSTRP